MTKKTSLWQRLKNAFTNTQISNDLSKPSDNPSFSQDLTGQVLPDFTQQNQNDTTQASAKNMLITSNDIEVMLASMGYHFSYHPPRLVENAEDERPVHVFTMQVSDGDRDWNCFVRFFEKEQLLAVYSIFPFSVPETHRGEMLAVLSYFNYDLVLGNLEMDIYDGEVRFKTSLDLEVTGLSEGVLAYLIQSNFSLIPRLHDTLSEVVAKSSPAQNASEAVDSLLSAQQEKTFYLMTDTLQ